MLRYANEQSKRQTQKDCTDTLHSTAIKKQQPEADRRKDELSYLTHYVRINRHLQTAERLLPEIGRPKDSSN